MSIKRLTLSSPIALRWTLLCMSLLIAYGVLITSMTAPPPALTSTTPIAQLTTHTKSSTTLAGAWTYDFSQYPDGALSPNDWQFEKGTKVADYHNELQAYTDRTSNVRVENGLLVIDAHREQYEERQFTSARITTANSFAFTYGTLEVDMMLPEGKGTWPAAWLMPRDSIYSPADYGIDKSNKHQWAVNGEIDFAEAIGRLPGQNIPAAHSYNSFSTAPVYTPAFIKNPYTQFHRYGIIKTADKITFTLDGTPYATRTKNSDSPLDWPFNQPYYLILNLAIGGNWAGQEGIDEASAPWQLKVRSISYTP